MSDSRELTASERSVLELILSVSFTGSQELIRQLQRARVGGGLPTLLDIVIEGEPPQRSPCSDGPVPVRAFVEADDGTPEGEILVWVSDGVLAGLEYAWVTDTPPAAFPPRHKVRLQLSSPRENG